MNGPEHYAEAERLLALDDQEGGWAPDGSANTALIQKAQVHATLALVAARYSLTQEWRDIVETGNDQ